MYVKYIYFIVNDLSMFIREVATKHFSLVLVYTKLSTMAISCICIIYSFIFRFKRLIIIVLLVNCLLVMLGILLMRISNILLRRHQEGHHLLTGMVIRNFDCHGKLTFFIV